MQYPYQGRDLFYEPENYFFSDCEDSDFFSSWKEYRREIIEHLKSINYPDPEDYPAWSFPVEYTKIGTLLSKAYKFRDPHKLAERLEVFVMKYEVNKKLYSEYDSDYRRVNDAKLADTPDYIIFGECLARISGEIDSLKHLSTLLKLCDALCTAPVSFPLTDRLITLLESEFRLVENVYK
jgi:hypothetical protein